MPETKSENLLEDKQEFNMSLPDPNLDKIKIDDKMDNLVNVFEDEKDHTAISDRIVEGEVNNNVAETLYTGEEAAEILRLQDSLKQIRSKTKSFGNYNTSKTAEERESLVEQKKYLSQNNISNADDQFAREMKMLDSVLNPEKYEKKEPVLNQPIEEVKRDIKHVSNAENISNPYFNTIKQGEDYRNIEGLLDEKIKVYQGSRIRIKLQNNIIIDGIELLKNSYIYGIVTGFNKQRINITIQSIAVNNIIYDVDLEVYDLDGIRGLYVPSSKFREFTQEVGAQSAQSSQSSSQTGQKSFMLDLASDLARTTSQTVSKIIKKNKANLKYNTHIILINNNTK
tara:strand:- start:12465 stop:13484 length:1020 start_codon:yes stop_codon:yes gene_type:complete